MKQAARRHSCPACGSFMGFTHESGDLVTCSHADYETPDNPCAVHGFAYHDLMPEALEEPNRRGRRLWELPIRYTGEHAPQPERKTK